MKAAGFSLLITGWMLVLSAIVLLPGGAARGPFLLAGMGVEALGLVLTFRSHLMPRKERP